MSQAAGAGRSVWSLGVTASLLLLVTSEDGVVDKLYLGRRKKCCYMVVITCLVFLIVSRDWSAYTLTLVPLRGWTAILSEKQSGPGRSLLGPGLFLVSR